MNKQRSDFATGSVAGHILYLAIPMIVAQLVQMIYNIVDRIYIGHIAQGSSLALSGLGLTFPVVTIIMAFTNLFSTGGVPLFSIARGANNKALAREILGCVFALLMLTSVAVAVFFYLFLRPCLFSLGASEANYPYARDYLLIYLAGTPLIMGATGLNGFINAQGFSPTAMITVVSGAIINILLDPLFIFQFGWGVSGAALASVISQGISFFWVISFFRGKRTLYRINWRHLRVKPKLLKSIVTLGFAGFVMQATNSAVQIACNVTLSSLGGEAYIGIMAVLNSIRDFVSAPLMGFSNASQPVIGYNYGADKFDRVKAAVKVITVAGVSYMLLAWVALLAFPEQAMGLFTSDTELIEKGASALNIYFFGFFMMAFQFAGQSTFTGLGLAKQAVFFSLFRKIIIVVPLTLILPHVFNLGVSGVFLAEPISNWVGGGLCFTVMLFTLRRLGKQNKSPQQA